MRFVRFIPAIAALFIASAASAQDWDSYINRENFFSVNLPGDPVASEAPYKTLKGANLTAHIFSAKAPADWILAGTYTITVVDYSNAKDEIPTAVDQAQDALKKKGKVTYEGINNLDLHLSHRLTIETANSRILAEILVAQNNRLYITTAENALDAPPAANFQASLQILDDKGVRIRTRTALGVPEGETSPISAGGVPDESNQNATQMAGAWRVAGGSCQAAYFKSGERAKTKRDENALSGTVTNAGKVVQGEIVLNGSREGQFIDPANDQAIMLFDMANGKLRIAGIGGPALGWPDVSLDLCPGSRG